MLTTLVGKELVSRLQGRLTYVILTLIVAVFTGLVLAAFSLFVVSAPTSVPIIGSTSGGGSATLQSVVASNRGLFLFYALAVCTLAAVFAVTPAVAGSAVSNERENNTFGLLLIAGLRARTLVLGKLFAAILFVLLLMLTIVPGFAIAWQFGGVAPRDVGLSSLLLLATISLISAVGVLFSTLARSSTIAALYTYALVYVLALGSLFIYVVGASTQNEALVRPILALNPFIALLSIPESVASSLQQALPFPYRGLLDYSSQEWLGQVWRYPRWVDTVVIYVSGTVVLIAVTGLLIDPCHTFRARFDRTRA